MDLLHLRKVRDIQIFKFYYMIINLLLVHFNEENEDDILYPLFFIQVKNAVNNPIISKNANYESLLLTYKIPFGDLEEEAFKYLIKFDKYKKLNSILNRDNTDLKSDLKDIIKDTAFQEKVINFYKSDELKEFLKKKIDKDLFEKIKTKYEDFILLISNPKFWDSIMFYTQPKNIKGIITNYLRVVLNNNFIQFNMRDPAPNRKKKILNFYLFIVVIHELCHLLRSLCLTNVDFKEAKISPYEEDVDKNNQKGEIGDELIKYFFGYKKICLITYNQAEKFESLSLNNKEDFEKLKKLFVEESFSEKYSDYAKFLDISPKEIKDGYLIAKGQCLNAYINQFIY